MHCYKPIKVPGKSTDLAEFIGIMLGDGNVYLNREKGVYQIKITNNSVTDKDYMLNFVKPLVEELFGVKASISFDKGRKGINLRVASMNLVSFLSSMGLVPGDKIKNSVSFPDWVKADENFLKPCIRGLFDTDGTVFHQSKYSSRLTIGFKNNNEKLLKDVRSGLVGLGFHPTKIIKNAIFIGRQNEVKRFLQTISFSNAKHKMKCACNSPVV